MIAVTTYIADDGKKFEDEDECLEYEKEQRGAPFKDSALLFDKKGEQLPLCDKSMEKCIFLVCKTDEAAEYLYNEFGVYELPWGRYKDKTAGAWIFDMDNWRPVDEILQLARVAKEVLSK